jgi:hypothetical protein
MVVALSDAHNGQPADLIAFLRACGLGPSIEPDFHSNLVQLVVSAWQMPNKSAFGWVVAMKNHRRLYLEYTLEGEGERTVEDLSISALGVPDAYPMLGKGVDVRWYRPTHINQRLGLADEGHGSGRAGR